MALILSCFIHHRGIQDGTVSIMFSPLEEHPRGHFTMFYLPKGHPRWHFIMFSPPEGNPSRHRSIQEGHFIMFHLPKGHLRGHFVMFVHHRVIQDGTLSCFLHWKGTLGSLKASMRCTFTAYFEHGGTNVFSSLLLLGKRGTPLTLSQTYYCKGALWNILADSH